MNIGGVEIVESPFVNPIPKLQLSSDYCGTEQFKQEMNAWLLDKFGTKDIAYLIDLEQAGLGIGKRLVISPKHAVKLRNFS